MPSTLTIATRNSPLALWQANAVKQQIEAKHPSVIVQLLPLSSKGDEILDRALAEFGGKGLFVKAIEQPLLDGRADIAVHSAKDMPPTDPEMLCMAGTLKREDSRDAWISDLPLSMKSHDIRVGTASPRRAALLQYHYPAMTPAIVRGNLATRIEKLNNHQFHGLILAMAGLKRLNHPILSKALPLDPHVFIPAAGQGSIAMQCRKSAAKTQAIIESISDAESTQCFKIERALLEKIQGNCNSPIGANATIDGNKITLRSCILNPEGTQKVHAEHAVDLTDAHTLVSDVFALLQAQKALNLLH